MNIYTPDKSKLKTFLIPPAVFAVVSCGAVLVSVGVHVGALVTCLIILAVVCTPFFLFILPTFLMEKIIIEDFTTTFHFAFLFIKVKQVLHIADIRTIEERYRNNKKGEPTELVISTPDKSITLSEKKYASNTILNIIKDYKNKNPKIKVTLLK